MKSNYDTAITHSCLNEIIPVWINHNSQTRMIRWLSSFISITKAARSSKVGDVFLAGVFSIWWPAESGMWLTLWCTASKYTHRGECLSTLLRKQQYRTRSILRTLRFRTCMLQYPSFYSFGTRFQSNKNCSSWSV